MGYLKSKVHINRLGNIHNLKDGIKQEMQKIINAMLQNIRGKFNEWSIQNAYFKCSLLVYSVAAQHVNNRKISIQLFSVLYSVNNSNIHISD